MVSNALRTPGYKSILHVDADNPGIFQAIKSKLESRAPGLTVMNLHEDELLKQLKNGDMYNYFRQGQGKNLAAVSDVARYPIMNKYGGIYLDTDDVIQANIASGSSALKAGSTDIILNRPVAHSLTDYNAFYNTSNFATHPDNPVIAHVITEMEKRFAANKSYFTANRPTVSRDSAGKIQFTPEFNVYETKIFETVGPTLFNDILKSKKPDIYDLGFDGAIKQLKVVGGRAVSSGSKVDVESNVRQLFQSKGITPPPRLRAQLQATKEHYLALHHQLDIKVGAEHSWINT
ncbi:glycosyltransferase [Pseudomonas fluorescens]|nr:glycosyltransferase [Pseudomonas fluorescens]